MTLSEAADKVSGLRLDTTKEFYLEPVKDVVAIKVYKTIPKKYIVSVEAWKKLDVQCLVLELNHSIRKRVKEETTFICYE